MISIVAAIDSKRGLGKNNDLLFKIPEDFARMKSLTLGHPIIMGRKTFESIGRVLPGRTNIVITHDPTSLNTLDYQPDMIVTSLEEAIGEANNAEGSEEIIIFGGGQIFKEAMEKDLVDVLHLTVVEARLDSPPESPARRGDFGADTFFPDYSGFDKVISESSGQNGEYKYKFIDLKK